MLHGFCPAQGFFIAHGFVVAQGFFIAQGFCFMAQGLAVLDAGSIIVAVCSEQAETPDRNISMMATTILQDLISIFLLLIRVRQKRPGTPPLKYSRCQNGKLTTSQNKKTRAITTRVSQSLPDSVYISSGPGVSLYSVQNPPPVPGTGLSPWTGASPPGLPATPGSFTK